MLKFRVIKLNWDKGNKEKCSKHGIEPSEIEEFFRSKEMFVSPDIKHSDLEDRYFATGKMPNGRSAFVAFTYREEKIRPISARYMHQKERAFYEKIISEI